MRLPAITTWAVTTEPIDRSNSPPTMTKYWPIAAIAIGATRCTNRMSCDGSANDGFSSVIATSSTMSSRNTAPRGLTSVRPRSASRRPRLGRSDVTALMPTPPVRGGIRGRRAGAGRVNRGRRRSSERLVYTATAATMTTPRTTSFRNGFTCMTLITLSTTAKIATPPMVPQIEPRPPMSSVPPSTTAAIESRS